MKHLTFLLIAILVFACEKDKDPIVDPAVKSFYMPVPSKFSDNLKSTFSNPTLNLTPLPEKYFDDIIMYLPFNENAEDSTGNFIPEVLDDDGNTAVFNDINDSTHIIISDQVQSFGTEFTICFWIYIDSANFQGIQGVFEKQFGDDFKMQVNVRYDPADEYDYPKLWVNIYKDFYSGSGGELKDGWNFFAIDMRNYDTFLSSPLNFNDPLIIGDNKYQWSSGFPATHFTGGIDEFIIFDRYLSVDEIIELTNRKI
jgi:hypothetical protein